MKWFELEICDKLSREDFDFYLNQKNSRLLNQAFDVWFDIKPTTIHELVKTAKFIFDNNLYVPYVEPQKQKIEPQKQKRKHERKVANNLISETEYKAFKQANKKYLKSKAVKDKDKDYLPESKFFKQRTRDGSNSFLGTSEDSTFKSEIPDGLQIHL